MGKRAQKSNKKEQAQATSKIQKSAKKRDQAKGAQDIQLFSRGFYEKVDQFKSLYNQINDNIAQSGNGEQFNLEDKFTNVKNNLEQNCSQILKNHLSEAQKWLNQKTQTLKEAIKVLERQEGEARTLFQNTGVLSEGQIDSSLIKLRQKIDEKIESLEKFIALSDKSKSVYH